MSSASAGYPTTVAIAIRVFSAIMTVILLGVATGAGLHVLRQSRRGLGILRVCAAVVVLTSVWCLLFSGQYLAFPIIMGAFPLWLAPFACTVTGALSVVALMVTGDRDADPA